MLLNLTLIWHLCSHSWNICEMMIAFGNGKTSTAGFYCWHHFMNILWINVYWTHISIIVLMNIRKYPKNIFLAVVRKIISFSLIVYDWSMKALKKQSSEWPGTIWPDTISDLSLWCFGWIFRYFVWLLLFVSPITISNLLGYQVPSTIQLLQSFKWSNFTLI